MERLDYLRAVALPMVTINCDTDQIIPAQYLQKPRSAPFGDFLFGAMRYREDGSKVDSFILNRAPYRPSRVVVANRNFGCGSSREHAVWALYDYGIRVVISSSFGDIFFSNCLKNGVLPVVLEHATVSGVLDFLLEWPGSEVFVDLPGQVVGFPDGTTHGFSIDAFSKDCLLNGIDELDFTLSRSAEIARYERDERGF